MGQAPLEAGGGTGEGAMHAWDAIRADPDIQYAPVELPEAPQAPGWLARFFEFLGELLAPLARVIAANWSFIWPVLAVLAGLLVLYVAFRLVAPDLIGRRRRKPGGDEAADWAPAASAARALLEDADRLAAAGRYDEATHLLLTRSVGQIAELRPELVEPSSTAREIAAFPALPEAARNAFAIIAARVEGSLFALRRLSAEDWQVARAAYADFALASGNLAAERRRAA